MCDSWLSKNCPQCGKRNFVCQGDLNDPTGYDPQGITCWNCKHSFDFDGEEMDPDDCDEGTHFEEVK